MMNWECTGGSRQEVYMNALSLQLTKRTEEDHERRQRRGSKPIPPEYEATPMMR
jgi:hypothetical protein